MAVNRETREALDENRKLFEQLRNRHGCRAETLIPDLALLGLADDVLDAADTALELLNSARPYRAYPMVRVAFEATQRLLVVATASDYTGLGTRAWLYYQEKENSGASRDSKLAALVEQLTSIWETRFPSAREIVSRELEMLRKRQRGRPDNFLGEDMGTAVHDAYRRIVADDGKGGTVPPNSAEINRDVYRALNIETHARPRLEPAGLRIDGDGFVQVERRQRNPAEVESAVNLSLSMTFIEAGSALAYRLHQRQLSHADKVSEAIGASTRARKADLMPDFGRYVVDSGLGYTQMTFLRVPVINVRGLADGSLSFSVSAPIDGVPHLATFDFRGEMRDKLLSLLGRRMTVPPVSEIRLGLPIEQTEPLWCDLVALLGAATVSKSEDFVPLTVVEFSECA